MLDLISKYSMSEILTFLVIFALSVRGVITFWDWAKDRIKKVFNKEFEQEKEIESIQTQIERNKESFQKIVDRQTSMEATMQVMIDKINLLLESDRDDIKSFITKEHHFFCYQKKWIDDYSLNCIEKRFNHYVEEGGNSFVEDLMNEIRALPKVPPEEKE